MKNPIWSFHKIDHVRKIVFIQDECDGNQRSVTNGAEDVVPIAVKSNPTYRLFYRDTEGQWDELVHKAGVFEGFAPGNGVKP